MRIAENFAGWTHLFAAVLVFATLILSGDSCYNKRHRLTVLRRLNRRNSRSSQSSSTNLGVNDSSRLLERRNSSGRLSLSTNKRLTGRGFPRVFLFPRVLLISVGRKLSPVIAVEPEDEALLGGFAVATVTGLVLAGPMAALLALGILVLLLRIRRSKRLKLHEMLVERGLPEVVDLLALIVAAGIPTITAFSVIAARTPEPFRSELAEMVQRFTAGEPFVESLRRLHTSLGNGVASLVHAISAAEIDGVPLRPALERVSSEAHRRRRVRAEEAARRVPVFMLFPLVFCILPAFCLLTIVPLLLGAAADLHLKGVFSI
ncbi:MAG: type II secretion system F family protein [Acidimicrobiaceae bacterium]|nr:type II secretion system F family protein [Acidimicrobiaceae bacterium]